jgi:hypothetical protein
MGMFDIVKVVGKFADKVVCPNGHKLTGEFQTKDLNQGLHTYIINDDKFSCGDTTREYYIAPINSFSGQIRIYDVCEHCPDSDSWCDFLFLVLDNEVVGFKSLSQKKATNNNIVMKDPYFEHENE